MLLATLVDAHSSQHRVHFLALFAEFEAAVQRLARGYERDAQRRRDLEQEIWTALWKALPSFEGRASERTWLYRIAHNVAATHLVRRRRDHLGRAEALDTDALATSARDAEQEAQGRSELRRLEDLIHALAPLDRQLVLLFLEGVDRVELAHITGLTVDNVSVRLSRLRTQLSRALGQEESP